MTLDCRMVEIVVEVGESVEGRAQRTVAEAVRAVLELWPPSLDIRAGEECVRRARWMSRSDRSEVEGVVGE